MTSPSAPSERRVLRHQLVRICPAAWESLIHMRADLAGEPLLRDWAANDWPLIGRRRLPTDGDGLSLGLPLPPSAGKRRIAVELRAADVLAVNSLPTIRELLEAAPVAWRPHLQALETISAVHRVRAGVFGSLCWQWLTGLTYLGPQSDVDIVWTLPRLERIDRFLDDLAAADCRSPFRLDGELVRADGAGVSWRQLRAGVPELAVKTVREVMLCSRAEFCGLDA